MHRLLVLAGATAATAASLTLPNIFGSNMVFQRNAAAALWGSTTAGARITVSFLSQNITDTADANGAWSVTLPAQPATASPATISITSSDGSAAALSNVLFGDVFVCGGQSNMELSIIATAYQGQTVNASSQYGAMLRLLQVAIEDVYANATSPQTNVNMSIPWSPASPASVPGMSAMCYFFGVEALQAHPDVPIGLISSNWGGTAIEVWMSPAALSACGEGDGATLDAARATLRVDPGVPGGSASVDIYPSVPSCLYYSMIYPLLTLPITAWLWYQGEANAGNPVGYAKCFPAMISQWRGDWAAATHNATALDAPFIFAQLSSWPAGDNGLIAVQRYAQQAALALPRVGMAVAADIGDPSGALHPIHPPWKAEVARRAFLAADNLVYGNASSPVSGPVVAGVTVDLWNAAWGNFHYGYGAESVCGGGQFTCAGIRVHFDQPIQLASTYGQPYGFANGLELLNSSALATGTLQPVTMVGVSPSDPATLQLNVTWIYTASLPDTLRYAWHDYPTMFIFGANGAALPAPPFNVSVAGMW